MADAAEVWVRTWGDTTVTLAAAIVGGVTLDTVVPSHSAMKALDLRGGLGDAVSDGYRRGGKGDPFWACVSIKEGWLVERSVGVPCPIVGDPSPFIRGTG